MIHDESTPRQWRHVDTCGNPADIASRGAKGSEPRKLELWLHSPNFLWKEEENWPGKPFQAVTVNVENALVVWTWSSVPKCWNHFCPTIPPGIVFWKAVAWLVRFKRYLVGLPNKDLDSIPKKPLTVIEVIAVESVVIKAVQHDVFSLELAVVGQIASGNQRKCVPRSSPICKLNPFVSEGILRVGGRLENAPVSFETGAYWISMTSWIPQLHVIQMLYYLFLHIRAYK